jgi:beta-galactosidase GanA
LLAAAAAAAAPPPAQQATAPVTFDRRSLLFDGERELWLAGSVHYPRFTPSQWPKVFAAMKNMGLNAVTTYVFWNVHQVTDT